MADEMPAAAVAAAAAAARAWARAGDGSADGTAAWEDAAAGALAVAEAYLGLWLVARDATETVEATGGWRLLTAAPVSAITAATDAGGTALTPERWAVDLDADGRGWVRVTPLAGGTVRVTCRAGLAAAWESVPPAIRQGVAMLAAHMMSGERGAAPPAAVAALWRPFRRLRLLERRTGAGGRGIGL